MRTYQYMWRLAAYRPWLYLLNGLFWTSIHLSPVLPGLVVRRFFDGLTGHRPLAFDPWGLAALLVAVALGRVALIVGGALADTTHRFNVSALLRRNMLRQVLAQPGARPLPEAPGEALNRIRDDARQAEDAISWTLDTAGFALFAVSAFVLLLGINARITALVFLPLIGVVAAVQVARTRLEGVRRVSREATARVTGALGEVFGAAQAIQLAGAEDHALAHLRRLNDRRRRTMLSDRLLREVLESIFGNTVSLGTGLILLLAAGSMGNGSFTVGDFALFVYYLGFVTDYTHFFGTFLAHYRQTAVAFTRMAGMVPGAPPQALVSHGPVYLAGPLPAPPAAPAAAGPDRLEVLAAAGLTYRYPESGRGIAGVSLDLRRGSFTVIIGRIGAGKTTLLRTLLGLLPADSGEVLWNGRPVESPGDFFIPPRTAYTPQVPALFSDTVRENILLGLPPAKDALAAAIRAAVLESDVAGMERGLDTQVGARGLKLSGGQVQRVAAARMFVRRPELLVFDDLSSALDVETERELWERLAGRRDSTCLVVSHRPAALRRADWIIVLRDGQVADQGALADLLERCEEMRHLWHGSNGH